jgi:HEAT repeat protein
MSHWSAGNRSLAALMIASVLIVGAGSIRAQDTAPAAGQAADATTAQVDAERGARLERYRAIIENRDDSSATRIAQAQEMLETGWPEATALAIRLLSDGDDPGVKSVLCQAIGNFGRSAPSQLTDRLVEPLLALLASADEDVARRAADALSTFASPQVAESLREVAGDSNAPLRARQMALTALTPNSHRREVAAALVDLLGATEPKLVNDAIEALRSISAVDFGSDVGQWRLWWEAQSLLSDRGWLESVLKVRSQRLRRSEESAAKYRQESEKRYADLAARLAETLASLFRQTPQGERDTLLVAWLGDASPEYRRAAAKLIAEQISEGNLPSEAIRAALVRRYADESPEVRRLSVDIVGALNEPSDATAMLLRMKIEQDNSVRETLLRVLGKLRNPDAVLPLIDEMMRMDASDACVAAAADSLGTLAARGGFDPAVTATMIDPLKLRFAQTPSRSRNVRIAILGAMAATGSIEFLPEFESHLAAEDPELLIRAIQGIAVVGNGAQLDRLSNLASHSDARVRQRAMTAIGDLGGFDQLSFAVARMSPAVETVEGPREAAWQAFRKICERSSPEAQVTAADRLVDLPVYREKYLKELHDRLTKQQPGSQDLDRVRESLARTFGDLGRKGEALPYWQALFTSAAANKGPRLHEFALAFLDCTVANDKLDQIPELLAALTDADARSRSAAESAVVDCLDRLRSAGRENDASALASALSARLADLLDHSYPQLARYLSTLVATAVMANTSGVH